MISTIEAAYRDFVGSLRNATRDRLDAIATGKGTGKFMGLGGDSGIGGLITDVKKWTQNNDKTKVIGSQSKSQTRVDYLAEKFNNLVIMPITMMTSGGNDAVLEDKTVLAALGGSTLVMNKKDVAIKVLLHDYELQPKIFGFKSDGSGEQDEAKYPSSLFGLIDAYATYFDTVFFKEKGDQAEGDTLAKFYVFVLEPLLTTVKALAKFFDPIMDGNDRAKFKDMIDKIEKIGKDISAMYDAPEVKELVDEEEGD